MSDADGEPAGRAAVAAEPQRDLLDAVGQTDDRSQVSFLHGLHKADLRLVNHRTRRQVDKHVSFIRIAFDTQRRDWDRELQTKLDALFRLWPHCGTLELEAVVAADTCASAFWQPFHACVAAQKTLPSVRSLRFTARMSHPPPLIGPFSFLDMFGSGLDDHGAGEGEGGSGIAPPAATEPLSLSEHTTGLLTALLPNLERLALEGAWTAPPAHPPGFYSALARTARLQRLALPASLYDDEGIVRLQGLSGLELLADEPQHVMPFGSPAHDLRSRSPSGLGLLRLPRLHDLTIVGRSFLPAARTPAELLSRLPPGLGKLRLRDRQLELLRLPEGGAQGAAAGAAGVPTGLAGAVFSGSADYDREAGLLQLGGVRSVTCLARLVHSFRQVAALGRPLQRVTVGKLVLWDDRAPGSSQGDAARYLHLFVTGLGKIEVDGLCAGYRARDTLLFFLCNVAPVRRLVLEGLGFDPSSTFWSFVARVGQELGAVQREPQQLCLAGYLGNSAGDVGRALSDWPPLHSLVAMVGLGCMDDDAEMQAWVSPPDMKTYLQLMRVLSGRVRPDGWSAICLPTCVRWGRDLAASVRAAGILSRVVECGGRTWECAAASETALQAAAEAVPALAWW